MPIRNGWRLVAHMDQVADLHRRRAERGRPPCGQAHAHADRHKRRDQDIHLGLTRDRLADLRGDDRHKQHRQRAACAAQCVGGKTNCNEREQHERRQLSA